MKLAIITFVLFIVEFLEILSAAPRYNNRQQSLITNIVIKDGDCPPPTTLFGPCIFNSTVNCLRDTSCPGEEKCCREGCNKICKSPHEMNTFIWEWFDGHAEEVSKFLDVSEDWVKQGIGSIWEALVESL